MDTHRIEELRAQMCPLEAPAALRREWLQQVAEHGETFWEERWRQELAERRRA